MSRSKYLAPLCAFCLLAGVPVAAEDRNPAAITPYADIRYRLELVDQEGLPEDATASTLRVRAGVRTDEWQGLSAVVEGEGSGSV